MKIFDKKDVYSWSNAEDAKQYIGKEGYFSDDLDELNREINENKLYPLKELNSNSAICFNECFETLFFDGVQILLDGKWHPFGVLDES